ncbi:hypothetical protein N9237_05565 [Akkermansiaceae bacterium]|nr:hypothetical protein [Akkermansiaceae bacterium]
MKFPSPLYPYQVNDGPMLGIHRRAHYAPRLVKHHVSRHFVLNNRPIDFHLIEPSDQGLAVLANPAV